MRRCSGAACRGRRMSQGRRAASRSLLAPLAREAGREAYVGDHRHQGEPVDQVGTTYVTRFGNWAKSLTTVIDAERPSRFRVKFGNWLLRGENGATFEEHDGRTRLIQTFDTVGIIPAITARIWASGSYKGSFRGELNTFKEICEREARRSHSL